MFYTILELVIASFAIFAGLLILFVIIKDIVEDNLD